MPKIHSGNVPKNLPVSGENKPGGTIERIGYKLFDWCAGGKEKKEFSFHFNQAPLLLNIFKKEIPAIGMIITNGDKKSAKNLIKGLCFGLSMRYLMEERVNGPGGGGAICLGCKMLLIATAKQQSSQVMILIKFN